MISTVGAGRMSSRGGSRRKGAGPGAAGRGGGADLFFFSSARARRRLSISLHSVTKVARESSEGCLCVCAANKICTENVSCLNFVGIPDSQLVTVTLNSGGCKGAGPGGQDWLRIISYLLMIFLIL